jgi:hypothetical protein
MGDNSSEYNEWEDQGKICLTGASGTKGASVSECKTYYSLSNIPNGPETGDDNRSENPVVNK